MSFESLAGRGRSMPTSEKPLVVWACATLSCYSEWNCRLRCPLSWQACAHQRSISWPRRHSRLSWPGVALAALGGGAVGGAALSTRRRARARPAWQRAWSPSGCRHRQWWGGARPRAGRPPQRRQRVVRRRRGRRSGARPAVGRGRCGACHQVPLPGGAVPLRGRFALFLFDRFVRGGPTGQAHDRPVLEGTDSGRSLADDLRHIVDGEIGDHAE